MTRKEEIAKASICQYQIIGTIGEQEAFKNGFVKGAEWADKTMINKVCEWLKAYANDFGVPESESGQVYVDDLVAEFTKAMED